jgi:hypothetical protein
MTTDFRALCARMADELDYYRQLLADDRREVHALAAEARAALAEPPPPADGEVGELVEGLRNVVTAYKSCHRQDNIWSLLGNGVNARLTVTLLTRAADLLERLAAPQPIPVSERLPGLEDCDAAGNCWWFDPHGDGAWYLDTFQSLYTHWLPAHALPVPEDQP